MGNNKGRASMLLLLSPASRFGLLICKLLTRPETLNPKFFSEIYGLIDNEI